MWSRTFGAVALGLVVFRWSARAESGRDVGSGLRTSRGSRTTRPAALRSWSAAASRSTCAAMMRRRRRPCASATSRQAACGIPAKRSGKRLRVSGARRRRGGGRRHSPRVASGWLEAQSMSVSNTVAVLTSSLSQALVGFVESLQERLGVKPRRTAKVTREVSWSLRLKPRGGPSLGSRSIRTAAV
jgi:hypothetical protein